MISAVSPSGADAEVATAATRAALRDGDMHPGFPQRQPVQPAASPKVQFDPEKLRENLEAAVDHLNRQLASTGRSLGFSIDTVMKTPIVTVRNSHTGEVVRQIPSEAVVKVAHTLEELKGLLYDASS